MVRSSGIGSNIKNPHYNVGLKNSSSGAKNELTSVSLPVRYQNGLTLELKAYLSGANKVRTVVIDTKSQKSLFTHDFEATLFGEYQSKINKDILEIAAVSAWMGWIGQEILRKSFDPKGLTKQGSPRGKPNEMLNSMGRRSYEKFTSNSTLRLLSDGSHQEDGTAEETSPDPPKREGPKEDMNTGVPRRSSGKPLLKGPCGNISDPTADVMIFTHDYTCSEVASRAVLGVCDPVEVDFLSCCQDHDIDLWCAPGLNNHAAALVYASALSAKLGACIHGKFSQAMTRIVWYCWAIDYPFYIIQTLLSSILYGIVTYFLSHGDVFINGPNEIFAWDGRNKDSCLCGGTKPTTWTHDKCTNLCTKHGKAQEGCFKCHMKCISDGSKFTRREWVTDPNLPCCPGFTRQCTNDCDETDVSKCRKGAPGVGGKG